jgi:hypothetical protein
MHAVSDWAGERKRVVLETGLNALDILVAMRRRNVLHGGKN